MYIHVQLVLTGNTSYILLLTEPLIIIWGIMTFSFQFIETSFVYDSMYHSLFKARDMETRSRSYHYLHM